MPSQACIENAVGLRKWSIRVPGLPSVRQECLETGVLDRDSSDLLRAKIRTLVWILPRFRRDLRVKIRTNFFQCYETLCQLLVWLFKNEISGNRVAVTYKLDPAGCTPPWFSAPISPFANEAVVDGSECDTCSMVPGTQKHFSIEKKQDAGGGNGGSASPCQ